MEKLGLALQAYAGRRVLITGHSGFKGGWLALWLHRLGAEVAGIALAPDTTPSLFEAAAIHEWVRHHIADIRDAEALARVVQEVRPEIVFHLAAQPLVRKSYREPLQTLATNVMGTANVLEAARSCAPVRAVLVVTTDKCYENRGWPWGFRESDPLGGHDPYSASKACAEIVTAAWRSAYWQQDDAPLVATARAGNVIGGGDWAEDRLIPDLVRAAQTGAAARIRNPGAVRPWQHVLEPLAGYLMLGAGLLAGERRCAQAWNFGPAFEDMRPVSFLCDAVCPALGARWERDAGAQPAEEAALRLDSSKAMLELGWRPRWALDEALRRVAGWYHDYRQGIDARALTLGQIEAYEHAAEPAP